MNNGNSKSLIPRNLTYRQKESFKTTVSSSDILSAIQSTEFKIPSASSISSDSSSFVTSNVSTLNVDIIKKKTAAFYGVVVNENVLITDLTTTIAQTFSFDFKENSSMIGSSLDLDIPTVEIRDNVIKVNSKYVSTFASFSNTTKKLYDSVLSGFYFPNINDLSSDKRFNNILIIPANYYIDTNGISLNFNTYTAEQSYFPGNDTLKTNSIRFIKSNYDFNKSSTHPTELKRQTLNIGRDSDILDLNNTNNLLNIEANNIALYGGKFVLLKKQSFNPTAAALESDSDTRAFSFYVSDISGSEKIFDIRASGLNVFGPIQIDTNIHINKNGISFGESKPVFQFTNYNTNDPVINFNLDTNKTTIYTQLDLSANGIINYNSLKFNNNNNNILTLTDSLIDTSANIFLRNNNPFIQFNNNKSLIIRDTTTNIISINKSLIDISANIFLRNTSPNISYKNNLQLINTETNDNPILTYNIISNSINYYEKKYLTKISVGANSSADLYCKNIVQSTTDQITFIGKVITKDSNNNSAHFTFEGFTQYDIASNTSNLQFILNTLYTPKITWTITSINLVANDLKIELTNTQSTITNWIVSLDSISI